MCKSIGLINDKISVDSYLKLIKTWMMDTTSLVALSINSGRVVGVAVTRINGDSDKTNIYERNQVNISIKLSHSNICAYSYVYMCVSMCVQGHIQHF